MVRRFGKEFQRPVNPRSQGGGTDFFSQKAVDLRSDDFRYGTFGEGQAGHTAGHSLDQRNAKSLLAGGRVHKQIGRLQQLRHIGAAAQELHRAARACICSV